MPDIRLPVSKYFDPDPTTPDMTYVRRAAVIDGFDFDWARYRIPRATVDATDIAQWLALEVADQALTDAGWSRDRAPPERTGVILGNTLTGEQTRSTAMRTRWPFVERVLHSAADAVSLDNETRDLLSQAMAAAYRSAFAPVTEDTLAGGLSNTIAGRICNHFDLHGGGYTVDGACASSLLAICTAASRLIDRDLDLALAGGVDISLDPFELVGFAKLGALTKGLMRVYDRNASGFTPGEGCGFVVMRRLDDALAAGDQIYAVVRGWGVSSDGRGGLTAPSREGQTAALRRAYVRAGIDMRTLTFIEGHGTGTPIGDRVELEAIALALSDGGSATPRSLGISSLKSLIGHTKAASGIAGFIKAVIAVNRRVIPAMAGCDEPNPVFQEATALYPIVCGEVRDPKETLCAGVSAMGFGGINTHVVMESFGLPSPRLAPFLDERTLLAANQDAELLVLTAPSLDALIVRINALATEVELASDGELTDLAAELAGTIELASPVRAGFIGDEPEALARRLRAMAAELGRAPPQPGQRKISASRDAWVAVAPFAHRIGFLFPGQGTQQFGMAAAPLSRFVWARELAAIAQSRTHAHGGADLLSLMMRTPERATNPAELTRWNAALAATEFAQPAITLTSTIYARWLAALGITPKIVGGHSLGELSAFHCAGALSDDDLFELAALRGRAMAAPPGEAGVMSSLACDATRASDLLADVDGYVVIANLNGPRQTVVSGEAASVAAVEVRAAAAGVSYRRLATSNAFHSRMIGGVATRIAAAEHLPTQIPFDLHARLVSSVTGDELLPGGPLRNYFATQAVARVDFQSLVLRLRTDCDLLLEVGPGCTLSGLVSEIIDPTGPICLPIAGSARSARDLLIAVAAAFCHGASVCFDSLFEGRLVRPIRPASTRHFIGNPCERSLSIPDALRIAATGVNSLSDRIGVPAPELSEYLHRRASFLGAVIRADLGDDPSAEDVLRNASSDERSEVSQDTSPALSGAESSSGEAPLPTVDLLIGMAIAQTGYPRAHVTPNARLLDDLNLDSIKAASLIATAAQQLGVAGRVDPLSLANASLADIAHRLDAVRGPTAEASSETTSWVRSFIIELVETAPPVGADLATARVHLIADTDDPFADALAITLRRHCAVLVETRVTSSTTSVGVGHCDAGLVNPTATLTPTHIVALLPVADERCDDIERLRRVVVRLATAAHLAQPQNGTAPLLALIQRGDGRFGGGDVNVPSLEAANVGFAASLHLERPSAAIRIVDISSILAPSEATSCVLAELGGDADFMAAGWDQFSIRRTRTSKLVPLGSGRLRHIVLGDDAIALVTGGARGITAECALALVGLGVRRFALVGSSPLDPVIAATVNRFVDAGADARYYRCDITRADDVAALVARVRAELGQIDVVLHGAGLNRPRRLDVPDVDAAIAEISPKVIGGRHLAREFASRPPRLFAALTSVIGITGMPGNAWYALSNTALDLILRGFADAHPVVEIASLAFGIWRDVGMGVTLGSVDALARLGVSAIPTYEGAQRFVDGLIRDHGDPQVIISAEISLDTFPPVAVPPVRGRFIDEVVRAIPGVEWVGRTTLTFDTDRYLHDHCYRGTHLFPTVFGLEAMAEAAAAAAASPVEIASIESIRLTRPIVVAAGVPTCIEIRVEVDEIGDHGCRRARATIGVDATGYAIHHFAATVILGPLVAGDIVEREPLGEPLDLQPGRDLYGTVLFHGPFFRRLSSVYTLDGHHLRALADASPDETLALSPPRHCGTFVLGDPFLRDALLHAVQLTIPRYSCLPLSIDAIERFSGAAAGSRIIEVDLITRDRDDFLAEVRALDKDGRLSERIRGYRLRVVHEIADAPSAEDLVAPGERDARLLTNALARVATHADLALPAITLAHISGLRGATRSDRHEYERPVVLRAWSYLRAVARDHAAEDLIWHYDQNGRPHIDHPVGFDLSLSHDDNTTVCAIGHGPQGIDLATEHSLDDAGWRALLGDPRDALRAALIAYGEPPNRAGTRAWAAAEAFLKAFGTGPHALALRERRGDLVLLDASAPTGECLVLTLPLQLTRGGPRVLAIVVPDTASARDALAPLSAPSTELPHAAFSIDATSGVIRVTDDGRVDERRRFVTSFDDVNGLSRRVSLARIACWMGRARELTLGPVAHLLVERLASGRFGLVTNRSRVALLGSCYALDQVESQLRLTDFADPGGEINCEFMRIADNGSASPIANALQHFTWVRVLNHGKVVPEPMPSFLRDFFRSLKGRVDAPHSTPPFADEDQGPVVVADVARPIATELFTTTREQSNLVGNIYWSNYFVWASAVVDAMAHAHASDDVGEVTITALTIEHTREAMPHDRIRVIAVARALRERGATFDIHFYREIAGRQRARLAGGRMDVVWTRLTAAGPAVAPWPEKLRCHLISPTLVEEFTG